MPTRRRRNRPADDRNGPRFRDISLSLSARFEGNTAYRVYRRALTKHSLSLSEERRTAASEEPASHDPLALAYYRYAWAVGDIGAFGEQVFIRPDLGSDAKAAAVDRFMTLFRPGEIVPRAFASAHGAV